MCGHSWEQDFILLLGGFSTLIGPLLKRWRQLLGQLTHQQCIPYRCMLSARKSIPAHPHVCILYSHSYCFKSSSHACKPCVADRAGVTISCLQGKVLDRVGRP